MSVSDEEFITEDDLVEAYRKAKTDVCYQRSQVRAVAFAKYESNLPKRIEALRRTLLDPAAAWATNSTFPAGHRVIGKGLVWNNKSNTHQDAGSGILYSCPKATREDQLRRKDGQVEFRPVADLTVDFHVFSALWINKAGEK